MSRSHRASILTPLLTFFIGAISMLLFLTPGETRYQDLLDPVKRTEMVDFDRVAQRVESVGDKTMSIYYAYQAKRYIKDAPKTQ